LFARPLTQKRTWGRQPALDSTRTLEPCTQRIPGRSRVRVLGTPRGSNEVDGLGQHGTTE